MTGPRRARSRWEPALPPVLRPGRRAVLRPADRWEPSGGPPLASLEFRPIPWRDPAPMGASLASDQAASAWTWTLLSMCSRIAMTSVSESSFTRRLGSTPTASSTSRAVVRPIPWM